MTLRFEPPDFEVPATLIWAIRASFEQSIPDPPREGPRSSRECEQMATLVALAGLAPRLELRVAPQTLARAFGAHGFAALLAHAEIERRESRRVALFARRVAARAERRQIPVVFLKFGGVCGGDPQAAERRPAADLDVLLSGDDAEHRECLLQPWGRSGAGVRDPDAALLDVHTAIPGLRLGGADSVGMRALDRLRHLEAWRGDLRFSRRLSRPLRMAQTVVHALAHHGAEPSSYRLLLAVADLVDEGATSSDRSRISDLAEPDVPSSETTALFELADRLQRGSSHSVDLWKGSSDAEQLLRHFLSPLFAPDSSREKVSWLFNSGTRGLAGESWMDRVRRVAFSRRAGDVRWSRLKRPVSLVLRWGPRVVRAAFRARMVRSRRS